MISLIVNKQGSELGYLIDTLYVPIGIIRLLTEGKISYESRIDGFIEKDRIVIPSFRKKFNILDREYTEKTGTAYLDILEQNKISLKRYALYGVSFAETNKYCKHSLWGIKNVHCRYAIYDTKQKSVVGYLLTSTDIFATYDTTIHVCMIEIKDKNKGIGSMVIRDLLKYKPLRGLADNSNKAFWDKMNAKFKNDKMHFTIE